MRAHSASEREAKAIECEQLAGELLDTWKREVSGAKGVTFYMHAVFHHLPSMIRTLPVDIILASGDAFEAKNQQLKRILRRRVSSRFPEPFPIDCVIAGEQTSELAPKTKGKREGGKQLPDRSKL